MCTSLKKKITQLPWAITMGINIVECQIQAETSLTLYSRINPIVLK